METYVIKKDSDLDKFKDEYGFNVNGHLEVKCSLCFYGRLYVSGFLSIESGGSIESGWSIEAGGSIEAGESIKAGWSIKAGESIESGESIEAGGSIKAGESIKAGWSIEAGESIKAGWSIKAGESIESGGSIESGWSIEAGGSIEAGESIEAGGSIKAGESIEAGGYHGISAGLSISCKGLLKYGLKCFAGICTWRDITDEEKTITCNKHEGGSIEYGILKETGIVDMIEEKEPKTKRVAVVWVGEVPKWWDDVETKNIEIVFRGHNNEEDYKEWSYVVEPVDMNRVSIETRESGAKIYHVDPPTPEPETVEDIFGEILNAKGPILESTMENLVERLIEAKEREE